jgi:uncharacterized membrane protein YhaH (DUF805 family)
MNYFLAAMRKYAVFQGRSSRSEFWWFLLFSILISVVAAVLDRAFGTAAGSSWLFLDIVQLVLLLPGLGVTIRRLHDIDRTGWWYLIGLTGIGIIVLLVFYCQRGAPGPNRFGPEPTETSTLAPQSA